MNFDIKRIKFEHNLGEKDKKIRMIAGCVLLALTLFLGNILLLILGIALVASAYTSWCPVYSGLGKNTCDASAIGSTESASATGSVTESADMGEKADTATGDETAASEPPPETEETHQP